MIYIIKAKTDGLLYFKIGVTLGCPWARLDQIKRQNLVDVELVSAFIGDKHDEMLIHSAFDFWRVNGEWFVDCNPIRKLIKDFPIAKWDSLSEGLEAGFLDFNEVYRLCSIEGFNRKEVVY